MKRAPTQAQPSRPGVSKGIARTAPSGRTLLASPAARALPLVPGSVMGVEASG
jgi:hypothetical protein